jgi:hypothetical protein
VFQTLQLIYFAIALTNDLIGTNEVMTEGQPWIRKLRDFIFAALFFPLAIDICSCFWGIVLVDKSGIATEAVWEVWERLIPFWLNQCIHTNPVIFVFIEMILLYHHYAHRNVCVAVSFIFRVCTLVWFQAIKEKTGHWNYPIYAKQSWAERLGSHMFTLGYFVSLYFFGSLLNRTFWRKNTVKEIIRKKNSENYNTRSTNTHL